MSSDIIDDGPLEPRPPDVPSFLVDLRSHTQNLVEFNCSETSLNLIDGVFVSHVETKES